MIRVGTLCRKVNLQEQHKLAPENAEFPTLHCTGTDISQTVTDLWHDPDLLPNVMLQREREREKQAGIALNLYGVIV